MLPLRKELSTMTNEQNNQSQHAELEEELGHIRHLQKEIAAITNDLNNLLGVMKGQAQIACDDPTGKEKDELVRVVLASTLSAEAVLRRIPLRFSPVDTELAKESRPAAPPPNLGKAIASILIADDEEPMRKLLARVLGRSGYDVILASSGAEAISIGCRQPFDLAFVDIQLGDMHGTEVYEAIRQHQPNTHIVFVSGDPALEQIASMPGRHSTAFIRKPFDIEEVKRRVSYILTMRATLQQE